MFQPQNKFEKSLVKATQSPAHRPQFYKDFVEATIFVIEYSQLPTKSAKITLEKGRVLQLQHVEFNGKSYIPIFSSVSQLQAFIKSEVGYLGMKVLDFLEIIKGAELFLNPGADYSKEFTKEEIENILNGSIWKPSEHFVVKQDTQILIGQPKNYPTQLVEELIKLFQKDKNVERAYIAHYHNPEENDPPHTLVGIAVKKYSEQTFAQAGIVVTNVEVPDPPVDFIRVQSSGGLSDYFNKSKPFYKRKKFGFF
ncbi:MAG: hypothetical protein GY755_06340 [Chloroflexi bacterium]|nr:hypothetical protein [Chloroflexota bacterium]